MAGDGVAETGEGTLAKQPGEGEEELLPPEFEVKPLGDDEFADFSTLLRTLFEDSASVPDGSIEDGLDALLAQALWGPLSEVEWQQGRLQLVVGELFGLLKEVSARDEGEDKTQRVVRPALCIMQALFDLALGYSLDQVCLWKARTGSQNPCALIFGHAGSFANQHDLQAKCYHSMGFNVIYATACTCPTRLMQRQFSVLARELKVALDCGGSSPRLVFHACSAYGLSMLNKFIFMWRRGEAPLDKLPRLEDCLAAVVFECVPVFGHHEEPDIDATASVSVEDALAMAESRPEDFTYKMMVNHCFEGLVKLHMPNENWYGIAARHNLIRFVKLLEPVYSPKSFKEGCWGEGLRNYVCGKPWWALDNDMKGQPVPRLILYSQKDALFSAEMVEASTDQMWMFNKKAKIVCEKLKTSPHMELWEKEPSACNKVLKAFMTKTAKLKKA